MHRSIAIAVVVVVCACSGAQPRLRSVRPARDLVIVKAAVAASHPCEAAGPRLSEPSKSSGGYTLPPGLDVVHVMTRPAR